MVQVEEEDDIVPIHLFAEEFLRKNYEDKGGLMKKNVCGKEGEILHSKCIYSKCIVKYLPPWW